MVEDAIEGCLDAAASCPRDSREWEILCSEPMYLRQMLQEVRENPLGQRQAITSRAGALSISEHLGISEGFLEQLGEVYDLYRQWSNRAEWKDTGVDYTDGSMTVGESSIERIACYRAFEERFRKPDGFPAPAPPVPIEETLITLAEDELGCLFPASYSAFVTNIGPCEVRGLSDAWLFTEHSDCPEPFEEFWPPSTVVKQHQHPWLAPIPSEVTGKARIESDVAWKYLLPFASDSVGNWHCFIRQNLPVDDAAVFYFDHDGGEIRQIASGLDDLIQKYMLLPTET